MTVISLFWYGSAHWQVTPSLSLISFTNSHVLYFFISFIFSLFLHSNAANILMFLILIPWYLFSVHILFRLNSDLGGYEFDTINGVPSYKAGADAAWVPFKREPIIEKASFSWAYSPSQTFPAKEGYKIVGLYADITGINSQNAVNINFGISKNLAAGRISISGQTYVNIMGAFYCIYA